MEQFGMTLLCWYNQWNEDFTQRLNIKPKVPQREESLCDQNKWLHAQYSYCHSHLCWLLTGWERDTTCDQVQVIHLHTSICAFQLSLRAVSSMSSSLLVHFFLSFYKGKCWIFIFSFCVIFVTHCATFRISCRQQKINNHKSKYLAWFLFWGVEQMSDCLNNASTTNKPTKQIICSHADSSKILFL